ncbi:MAG TPA: response regulator transcription factor [Pirellulaceae bacterium]|nr:response regulator transcription factor [Pirellulaceae bacterium]
MANSLRILLVDDYEPIRALVSRLLSRQNGIVVVGVAGTGEEAIDLAQEFEPDVVVMDVVMPGVGGVEATRRLRQALPKVRVVGHSANEAEAVMRAAGAVGFVRKGEATHVLVDAIRAAAV